MPDLIKKGDDPRQDWRIINRLTEELNRIRGEVRVLNSAVADLRNRKPFLSPGGAGAKVSQFIIASVGDDTLTCHTYEGTTEGTAAITILKPYLLRKSTYDDLSRTIPATENLASIAITYDYTNAQERDATATGFSDHQVITPRYLADDIIYAAEVDGASADWVDLNVDGRAWSRE